MTHLALTDIAGLIDARLALGMLCAATLITLGLT